MTTQIPLKNTISLGVIGCVSTGKSTLVNSILTSKVSSTKIKRTTMLPQVYIESDNCDCDLTSIRKLNNESNKSILNGDTPLTYDNCLPIYHEIPK